MSGDRGDQAATPAPPLGPDMSPPEAAIYTDGGEPVTKAQLLDAAAKMESNAANLEGIARWMRDQALAYRLAADGRLAAGLSGGAQG